MRKNKSSIFRSFLKENISSEVKAIVEFEKLKDDEIHQKKQQDNKLIISNLYSFYDSFAIRKVINKNDSNPVTSLKTLEELLEQDNQRETDGFPRRIRMGKFVRPVKGKEGKVVVVPTTYEPKFYHDDSITEEDEETGGSGDGNEGDIIGESPAEPQESEGEGTGAGQGSGSDHEILEDAFNLGKLLTEKFNLPNLKDKGKKKSLSKLTYDLTDINRGFGQILDKKATIKKIIGTNILLDRFDTPSEIEPSDLIINPKDNIYRILSSEKDFESQAIVFFIRDYSGSMQGKPTEVITQQHLFIYSWLIFQYKSNVVSRFILHDTEAKEVKDFYTYHKSQVAGGTNVWPSFALVNKIVEEEHLAKDYNIYIFYGTDGDDWDQSGENVISEIKKTLLFANRIGITIAKNSWSSANTTIVERYLESSGILTEFKDLIKMQVVDSENATEEQILQGIKLFVS